MLILATLLVVLESKEIENQSSKRESRGFGSIFDRFKNAGKEVYKKAEVIRTTITGPDGRCGYRRGTFCYTKLTSTFTACAAAIIPDPSDVYGAIALQAGYCLSGYTGILSKCRECIRDVCKITLTPLRKDQHCNQIYNIIQENIEKAKNKASETFG